MSGSLTPFANNEDFQLSFCSPFKTGHLPAKAGDAPPGSILLLYLRRQDYYTHCQNIFTLKAEHEALLGVLAAIGVTVSEQKGAISPSVQIDTLNTDTLNTNQIQEAGSLEAPLMLRLCFQGR